jgi:hypothetical protein
MTKATTTLSSIEMENRLGWRFAEFSKMIGMSRLTLSKMQKAGQLQVVYFGDVPIVARAEAIRLGLISA